MEHVFLDTARHWDDRPVIVEDAKLVEEKMTRPLENLIEVLEADATSEEIFSILNEVVSAYLISFK